MLHVWLIPVLLVLFLVLFAFYMLIKTKGGSGSRTDGRTLVDEPTETEDLPPG